MNKKATSFLVCFLILVLFSGFVFFLGWTQFKVNHDQIGVIVSKTGGISKDIVKNGEFSWHWEFIIPSNAELRLFSTKPFEYKKNISGSLLSGSVYSSIYKNAPDFSYNFDFSIIAVISQEKILELLKSSKISDQNSLDLYMTNACDEYVRSCVDYLIEYGNSKNILLPETTDFSKILREQNFYIDSEIKIERLDVRNVKIPDIKLYNSAKEKFLKNIERYNQNEKENDESKKLLEKSEKEAKESLKIEQEKNKKLNDLFNELKNLLSSE